MAAAGAHGWLLARPHARVLTGPAALWSTASGGRLWTRTSTLTPPAPPPGRPVFHPVLTGIAFRGSRSGWATASDGFGDVAWLARTADAGRTWARKALPVADTVHGQITTEPPVFFHHGAGIMVSLVTARAVAQWAVIYRTADGGAAWSPGKPLRMPLGQRTVIFFLDADHGWLASHFGQHIYRTSDGGRNWRALPGRFRYSGPGAQRGRACTPLELDFTSPRHGWMLLATPPVGATNLESYVGKAFNIKVRRPRVRTTLAVTDDAGAHWHPVTPANGCNA